MITLLRKKAVALKCIIGDLIGRIYDLAAKEKKALTFSWSAKRVSIRNKWSANREMGTIFRLIIR